MPPSSPTPPPRLIVHRDIRSAGLTAQLQHAVRDGTAARVRHGVYRLRSDVPTGLAPGDASAEAHRAKVHAIARTWSAPVFTGWSAAALLGLPILGGWPEEVVVMSRDAHGHRRAGVVAIARRHEVGTELVDGLRVTPTEFTLIQLCRTAPFMDALVAVEAALRADRFSRAEPMTTLDRLRDEHVRLLPYRGSRKTEAVLDRAHERSDSPLETLSMLVFEEAGFMEPVQQHRIWLPEIGRHAELDFFWPEVGAAAEADGRGKYRSSAATSGSGSGADEASARLVIAEKDRENAIRRQVRAFDRWDWADVRRRTPVVTRLRAMGVPVTRRPRPGLLAGFP